MRPVVVIDGEEWMPVSCLRRGEVTADIVNEAAAAYSRAIRTKMPMDAWREALEAVWPVQPNNQVERQP